MRRLGHQMGLMETPFGVLVTVTVCPAESGGSTGSATDFAAPSCILMTTSVPGPALAGIGWPRMDMIWPSAAPDWPGSAWRTATTVPVGTAAAGAAPTAARGPEGAQALK